MNATLKKELRLKKPLGSLEEEVFLNLLRTAEALQSRVAALFKTAEVSSSQYNVLRILRGAGKDGLPCNEIAGRMVARDPDMTRLLDGLEKRQLATRSRSQKDRRVVRARISKKGEQILKELDEPLEQLHKDQLGHMGRRKLKELSGLLELARRNAGDG